MSVGNAVEWHSNIASNFNEKYTKNKNFQERYEIWTEIIDKYSRKNYHALDIGCGSGNFTFYLAGKNKTVIGLDASSEMLEICCDKQKKSGIKNVNFINSKIESMNHVLEEKADILICSSVLEYLDDFELSLKLIKKLMNKNGLFLFSLPNSQSFYRKIESLTFNLIGRPKYYRFVKNVYSMDDVRGILEKLGFLVLESIYYGKTPFLSTALKKVGASHYSDNLFIVVAQLSSLHLTSSNK